MAVMGYPASRTTVLMYAHPSMKNLANSIVAICDESVTKSVPDSDRSLFDYNDSLMQSKHSTLTPRSVCLYSCTVVSR